ncbi:MAG: permease-like cell division protein FtsX [Anaerovoracaceae bacterium]|nr:permease-like cell division protein FtsX [Anaerovoracaceae bacterium]
MSGLIYAIKQSFRQISRNKAMSFASVFAITAMLLILGLFFIVVININSAAKSIEGQYDTIEVFLKDSVNAGQTEQIKEELSSMDNVSGVEYRTKEQAMEILRKRWGDKSYLLDDLKNNPLPDSFVVSLRDLSKADATVSAASSIEGVEDVNYYKDTVEKLMRVSNGIQTASLIIIAFLILISIVVVSNTIKLTVFNRADEISIMKYIGATNWFIRGPFLGEGIIIGCISAIVSSGIIALIYYRVTDVIGDKILSMMSIPMVPAGFLTYNLVWIFLALGISIGALGSILSMRRYLDT